MRTQHPGNLIAERLTATHEAASKLQKLTARVSLPYTSQDAMEDALIEASQMHRGFVARLFGR